MDSKAFSAWGRDSYRPTEVLRFSNSADRMLYNSRSDNLISAGMTPISSNGVTTDINNSLGYMAGDNMSNLRVSPLFPSTNMRQWGK